MSVYQKFRSLKIDYAAIGMEQGDADLSYFCTPRGARIIGWTGVDGVHFCFIRGFGEMVFAVSPMNEFGEYVHPVARNFTDLLRLLLACGSMDGMEQAYFWDEGQFDSYVRENRPTPEGIAAMDVIKEKLSIEPMEQPFSYIKDLQAGFDYSRIKYPPEYYDADMNPAAEEQPSVWKVSYGSGFWKQKGRAGREIAVNKVFHWEGERWYIPAIYICGRGLVVDFCLQADAEVLKSFIDKWDLLHEARNHYTKEQQQQLKNEHPLHVEFHPEVTLNGKKLPQDHGCGISWMPAGCQPENSWERTEMKDLCEHYELDRDKGWSVWRYYFPWATKRKPDIKSLKIHLERRPAHIPGFRFQSPEVGGTVSFSHPLTGVEYTLTVHKYEAQELGEEHFRDILGEDDKNMEYPPHFIAMTYTITPDIGDYRFMLQDYDDGD